MCSLEPRTNLQLKSFQLDQENLSEYFYQLMPGKRHSSETISTIPRAFSSPNFQTVDELDEPLNLSDEFEAGPSTSLQKRGRGRPKGSKNKKSVDTIDVKPARKRGRPPKEKTDDTREELLVKRPRGRPRKNPKPEAETAEGGDKETQKKRGRKPKKKTE
ncbi:hypothetical protein BDQ17DRAFT_1329222 [Cyathus striatus]|nr:hypothetical protein BDQ17DRAFT_1329222 [Cyathus striatus]